MKTKLNFLTAMLLPIVSLQSKFVLIPFLLSFVAYYIIPMEFSTVGFYATLFFVIISIAVIKYNLTSFDLIVNWFNENKKIKKEFTSIMIISLFLDFFIDFETRLFDGFNFDYILISTFTFFIVGYISLFISNFIDKEKKLLLNKNKNFLINLVFISVSFHFLSSILCVPIIIYLLTSATYFLNEDHPQENNQK